MTTTQASTLDDASFPARSERQARTVSAFERLSWSVRREIWENRSIYLAPLAAGALVLLGFAIVAFRNPMTNDLSSLNPAQRAQAVNFPYAISAAVIMATAVVVALFYCLDALYGERRDRSILFWKSLPVSDTTTVLAKAAIPVLVLPLVGFGATVLTQSGILLVCFIAKLATGGVAATAWTQVSLSHQWGMLLYHLITVHALWYAPLYGWLLLASAWAPKAPFLWAFLPPAALAILEAIIFHTSHILNMLHRRLGAGTEVMGTGQDRMSVAGADMHITLGRYLSTPGLWLGLLLAAVFLAAAVRLRRYREPI